MIQLPRAVSTKEMHIQTGSIGQVEHRCAFDVLSGRELTERQP